MNLIPKFLRPYPTLRLFGRPIRQPDMKAVDPEPVERVVEIERPGFVFDMDPEPAHPDVVVLRVVHPEPELERDPAERAWDTYNRTNPLNAHLNAQYRPVCSHEGLNEWGPPASLEQVTADIRAISIPSLTVAEIMAPPAPDVGVWRLGEPMLERMEAARTGTIGRDAKGRFLPANRGNGR